MSSSIIKIDDRTDYFELLSRIDGRRIFFDDQLAMTDDKPDRRYWILRHDVDRAISNGMLLAERENRHGVTATYFLLHTARYWDYSRYLVGCVRDLVRMGHRVGLHIDSLGAWAECREAGLPAPDVKRLLVDALRFLRKTCGIDVRGCAAHGNRFCGKYRFNNYHVFSDWELPETNTLGHDRFPMSDLGLEYEAYHLPRVGAFADSGGKWRGGMNRFQCPFAENWKPEHFTTTMERVAVRDKVIELFNGMDAGVLTVLIHPNWWEYH